MKNKVLRIVGICVLVALFVVVVATSIAIADYRSRLKELPEVESVAEEVIF